MKSTVKIMLPSIRVVCILLACILSQHSHAEVQIYEVDGYAYVINPDQASVKVVELWSDPPGLFSAYHDYYSIDIVESVMINGQAYVVTDIEPYLFSGSLVKTATLPNTLKAISECLFMDCSQLKSINLGNSITTIERQAFLQCKAMTDVVIPNSVTSIEYGAFEQCASLSTVTIPSSVIEIGEYLFGQDTKLAHIYCYITQPDQVIMGENVFEGVPTSTCVLHVPKGTKALYQQAEQWKDFVNIDESLEAEPDSWIEVDKTDAMMKVGDELQLTATSHPAGQQVIWSSGDIAVATVDADGKVKAVADGSTTITAMCGELTATCVVTVLEASVGVVGDVCGDGDIDVSDINAIINRMFNLTSTSDLETKLCDINEDAQVDIADVNELINIMLAKTPRTTVFTVNGVSFKMIQVQGGSFTMGDNEGWYISNSPWDEPDNLEHQVIVNSFSIAQTEVTQELWVAIMNSNPSYFNETGNSSVDSDHEANYGTNLQRPVDWVSWFDCQTFIAKLNELFGESFRLPTEAEWEYAARGGNKGEGYRYAGSDYMNDVGWYIGNIPSRTWGTAGYGTQTVATKVPNELGLYDMSGNVCEWCQDWYGRYYYESSPVDNPAGPISGTNRVTRGGGYLYESWFSYAASRMGRQPSKRSDVIGLRLAR